MKETSISAGLLLIVIAGIIYASGIWKKVEFLAEARLYRLYCEYRYKDPQFCQFAENRIRQIKVLPFRQMEERDRQVAYQVYRELLPYYLAGLSAVLAILFYRKKNKPKQKTKKTAKAVKLFKNPQLQKVVDNFYQIGGKLTERQIKLLKEVEARDEVKLALLMIFARENMNFAAKEVAEGVKDETFLKIIFSAGRPALPPSVFPFYLQAKDLLRSQNSGGQEKQGQQSLPPKQA